MYEADIKTIKKRIGLAKKVLATYEVLDEEEFKFKFVLPEEHRFLMRRIRLTPYDFQNLEIRDWLLATFTESFPEEDAIFRNFEMYPGYQKIGYAKLTFMTYHQVLLELEELEFRLFLYIGLDKWMEKSILENDKWYKHTRESAEELIQIMFMERLFLVGSKLD